MLRTLSEVLSGIFFNPEGLKGNFGGTYWKCMFILYAIYGISNVIFFPFETFDPNICLKTSVKVCMSDAPVIFYINIMRTT